MSVEITRKKCGEGMSLTKIHDEKFKTFGLSVRMTVPFDDEYCHLYPLVLDVLVTCTRRYPEKEQLTKALTELYSAAISTSSSRSGKYLILTVFLNCICDEFTIGREKISDKAARLLIECLTDPYLEDGMLSQKYVKLCKSDMLDDIDAIINNKRRYAATLAKKHVFKGELTALSAYDQRDDIAAADCRAVTEAYYKLLRTADLDIAVTGGSCDSSVEEMLISSLNGIDREPVSVDSYYYPSPLKPEVLREEISLDANQCQLVMAYKTETYNEYAAKLFAAMLGATPMSKLFMNVREKLSLCYYCDSMLIDMKNTLMIFSGLDADNLEIAEREIDAQLRALQQGDFTDEELENAKLYLSEAYLSNYDTKFDILMWYYFQFMHGTSDTPEEKGAKIKALTREDIIAEASNYKLDTVFVLRPQKGGRTDEA